MKNPMSIKIPNSYGGYTDYETVTKKLRETRDIVIQNADLARGWLPLQTWLDKTEAGRQTKEVLDYINYDMQRALTPFIEYAKRLDEEEISRG